MWAQSQEKMGTIRTDCIRFKEAEWRRTEEKSTLIVKMLDKHNTKIIKKQNTECETVKSNNNRQQDRNGERWGLAGLSKSPSFGV